MEIFKSVYIRLTIYNLYHFGTEVKNQNRCNKAPYDFLFEIETKLT